MPRLEMGLSLLGVLNWGPRLVGRRASPCDGSLGDGRLKTGDLAWWADVPRLAMGLSTPDVGDDDS